MTFPCASTPTSVCLGHNGTYTLLQTLPKSTEYFETGFYHLPFSYNVSYFDWHDNKLIQNLYTQNYLPEFILLLELFNDCIWWFPMACAHIKTPENISIQKPVYF